MEVILILLAATIMSGFLCGSFYLGMKFGASQKESNTLKVDESNIDNISQMMEWMSYRGK